MNRNCHQRSSKSMCAMQVHKAGWLVICKHITLLATFSSKNEGLHPASWAQPRGHIRAQSPTLQTIPSYRMLQTHKKRSAKIAIRCVKKKLQGEALFAKIFELAPIQVLRVLRRNSSLRSHETLQETTLAALARGLTGGKHCIGG